MNPVRLKKSTNLAADVIPVNNFFGHWVKEIDRTMYDTNKSLILTTAPQEIYWHSESLLKHDHSLLYSKKAVVYPANSDRRIENSYDTT